MAHKRPLFIPAGMVLLLALCLVGFQCTKSKVTLHGEPVSLPSFVTATTIVHNVEVGAVAVGDALISYHQIRCDPLPETERLTNADCVRATTLLRTNATTIAPKVLMALQAAKHQLQLAGKTPAETTEVKLQQAVSELTTAHNDAVDWAKKQGFTVVNNQVTR